LRLKAVSCGRRQRSDIAQGKPRKALCSFYNNRSKSRAFLSPNETHPGQSRDLQLVDLKEKNKPTRGMTPLERGRRNPPW
jgi:hypothetical protein